MPTTSQTTVSLLTNVMIYTVPSSPPSVIGEQCFWSLVRNSTNPNALTLGIKDPIHVSYYICLQLAQLVEERCDAAEAQDFKAAGISTLDASWNELTSFSGLEGCHGLHTLLVPNNKIRALSFVRLFLLLRSACWRLVDIVEVSEEGIPQFQDLKACKDVAMARSQEESALSFRTIGR